jgi:murein DD-endopeptidase MepM/ murein hydrolase activator NlpD
MLILLITTLLSLGASEPAAGAPACSPTHRLELQRALVTAKRPARIKRLRAALASCRPESRPLPAATGTPFELAFYPQSGDLWRDLVVTNFVDLDLGPGIRDWNCGRQTYDGHGGQDSALRSFREQRIGVPVFAALDGRVLEVVDQYRDENTAATTTPYDNHVVLDHGNDQLTVYGHLRRSSTRVQPGDWVPAGTQLGLTGSSGNSTGPHLHFGALYEGRPYEPFAGPCRFGPSRWVAQVGLPAGPYLQDVALSTRPFTGRAALPWDEGARTGTFVTGLRTIHARFEPIWAGTGATAVVTVERPDGSTALRASEPLAVHSRGGAADVRALRLRLTPGRWRLHYQVDGKTLTIAPFDVVGNATAVRNRPPNPVRASVERAGVVLVCRVHTSLAAEDPDYAIVAYRYRWLVDGRIVRAVRSAGLTDVLPLGKAPDGATCAVTPTDGQTDGPTAATA